MKTLANKKSDTSTTNFLKDEPNFVEATDSDQFQHLDVQDVDVIETRSRRNKLYDADSQLLTDRRSLESIEKISRSATRNLLAACGGIERKNTTRKFYNTRASGNAELELK